MDKTPDKRLEEFLKLAERARNCRVCEAMCGKTAVLSELNGSIDPKVFFIAEAPGRQGADRTRKPFSGDKSGANFQMFLDSINLRREEIFITNTVLCSPRSETGANRKPSKKEIRNCAPFLEKTINLINPKIIVTLGTVALEALKTIEYHQIILKSDAARIFQWNGRKLVPLYHPSPQVIASRRRMHEQLEDFKSVAEAIGQV
ncbi:MAG TPA: uracil-DNA glycosylase [Pyrinomonadaceae bacterium]|jgi:DNA polymerase|nr:uracil-DNA glycosylase [Pyrinomonadaceae bacterium]